MTKRILVTGHRRLPSQTQVREIRRICAYHPRGTILVHGDCAGIDKTAAKIAVTFGLVPEPHPYLKQRGKAGGPERNQEMVDSGIDEAFAFPDGQSVGTWDCVRKLEAAGVKVTVFGWSADVETP